MTDRFPFVVSIAVFLLAQDVVMGPQAAAANAPGQGAARTPSCTVSGRVVAEGGAPVGGALVAAIPSGGSVPAAVTHADATGHYCFTTLAAGSYGFTMTARDRTAAYVDVRAVTGAGSAAAPPAHRNAAAAGADNLVIEATLGGPGFTLAGHVIDERGQPVPEVRVLVARVSRFAADLFVTEADSAGRYLVRLPPGQYQLLPDTDRFTVAEGAVSIQLERDVTTDLAVRRTNPPGQPAADEVVAGLRSAAIPLRTVEAGHGLDDMEPLRTVIGDARIVALGEQTHGTREFFQLKHRMLEFLVERMGFRTFAIEASFGNCLPITEYVATGRGDPQAALANQHFWTWDTQEVLALITWMRAYNADPKHRDKLAFYGMDMQIPAASALAMLSYFGRVDAARVAEIAPGLDLLDDDLTAGRGRFWSAADKERASAAVGRISALLDARRVEYTRKAGARAYGLARVHARVLNDFVRDLATSGVAGVRDESMAAVTADLLDLAGPGSRLVVWAHNEHVRKDSPAGFVPMGMHLDRRFGARYFAFGFAFDQGAFQSIDLGPRRRGLIPFTLPSAPPGSFDHTLARTGIPLLALDLRRTPEGPAARWLSIASQTRSIGSGFQEELPDSYLRFGILPQQYDALLFVEQTTAARPNESGRRLGAANTPPLPTLTDPDFEGAPAGALPAGWTVQSMPRQLDYRATIVARGCASGKHCVRLTRESSTFLAGFGQALTVIDAAPLRGKKVQISAMLRVGAHGRGDKAVLQAWINRAGSSNVPQLMALGWATGPTWHKAQVTVDVPADAQALGIALGATGAAVAGMDDVRVDIAP